MTQPLWHLIPKGQIFLDSITFAQSQDLQCLQLSLFGHGQAGRSWGQGFHEEIRFHGGLSKACFRKLSKIAGFFFCHFSMDKQWQIPRNLPAVLLRPIQMVWGTVLPGFFRFFRLPRLSKWRYSSGWANPWFNDWLWWSSSSKSFLNEKTNLTSIFLAFACWVFWEG